MRLVRDKSQVQEPKGLTECSLVLLLEIENYLSSLSLFSLDEDPIRGMLLTLSQWKEDELQPFFFIIPCSHQFLAKYFQVEKETELESTLN